jgi:hypothetical protein
MICIAIAAAAFGTCRHAFRTDGELFGLCRNVRRLHIDNRGDPGALAEARNSGVAWAYARRVFLLRTCAAKNSQKRV